MIDNVVLFNKNFWKIEERFEIKEIEYEIVYSFLFKSCFQKYENLIEFSAENLCVIRHKKWSLSKISMERFFVQKFSWFVLIVRSSHNYRNIFLLYTRQSGIRFDSWTTLMCCIIGDLSLEVINRNTGIHAPNYFRRDYLG